jgi:putative nucleotidyltransferase with HDIG domain
MQCPGQDTRYWTPDDIFEVPCQACDTIVEFFKTDVTRRCPGCGKRIQNVNISLGCARWCSYARVCLGFDPAELQLEDTEETSIVDRLVDAAKQELGDAEDLVVHSLLVLDRAQDILRREEADPRVVLAAAVLHDIGVPEAQRKHGSADAKLQEAEGATIARRIMEDLGMREESIDHVCRIVQSHHSADDLDTPEFRIVWDADRLEEAPEGFDKQEKDRLSAIIDEVFRTETGKQLAHKRFVE